MTNYRRRARRAAQHTQRPCGHIFCVSRIRIDGVETFHPASGMRIHRRLFHTAPESFELQTVRIEAGRPAPEGNAPVSRARKPPYSLRDALIRSAQNAMRRRLVNADPGMPRLA